jgi:modification methylase
MDPYYDDGQCTIWCADNLDVLPALSDVPLIFTSPPYNLGVSAGGGFGHYADEAGMRQRSGGGKWTGGALAHGYADHSDAMPMDEYEAWQRDFLSAAWTALSDTGAIYYNHKPRISAGTLWTPLDVNPGLPVRQIVIWARAGGMNFAPTHYVPTHEWIVVLAKPDFRLKSKAASGVGDVWQVTQEQGIDHPAPFPVGLPARAIETVAPTLILDPYMGSGTTLVAAKAAGVKAIGIEKSERYCEVAVRRLQQESLFAASPQRPVADQDSLFT